MVGSLFSERLRSPLALVSRNCFGSVIFVVGVSYAPVITLSLQCDVLLTGRKLHTLSLPPSEPLTGLCKHQRGSKQAKMLSSFSMIEG